MADGVAVCGKEPGAGEGVLIEGNGSRRVEWAVSMAEGNPRTC